MPAMVTASREGVKVRGGARSTEKPKAKGKSFDKVAYQREYMRKLRQSIREGAPYKSIQHAHEADRWEVVSKNRVGTGFVGTARKAQAEVARLNKIAGAAGKTDGGGNGANGARAHVQRGRRAKRNP